MKPLIGITAGIKDNKESLGSDNVKAIIEAGGIPVILSNITENADVQQLAQKIDGLYVTGGPDIDPLLFGEEPIPELGSVTPQRDEFELAITKEILKLDKPMLGVCRGAQILNVATGGDLYQDIYSQINDHLIQHRQKAPKSHAAHFVDIVKDSVLHRLVGEDKIKVNTLHHQAVKNSDQSVLVSGRASDGIIEAIEVKNAKFAIGVQWHPEGMVSKGDKPSLKIYESFIKSCIQQ